jgi:hypothetical protein
VSKIIGNKKKAEAEQAAIKDQQEAIARQRANLETQKTSSQAAFERALGIYDTEYEFTRDEDLTQAARAGEALNTAENISSLGLNTSLAGLSLGQETRGFQNSVANIQRDMDEQGQLAGMAISGVRGGSTMQAFTQGKAINDRASELTRQAQDQEDAQALAGVYAELKGTTQNLSDQRFGVNQVVEAYQEGGKAQTLYSLNRTNMEETNAAQQGQFDYAISEAGHAYEQAGQAYDDAKYTWWDGIIDGISGGVQGAQMGMGAEELGSKLKINFDNLFARIFRGKTP